MTKKMLIDASHPEETRVAILDEDGSLQDYEFKSSTKETVKGNIYLAKIARVEPSLQAAFVDYGGNRHGFLAFSEIHPDYFRIPISDRDALEESIEKEIAEKEIRIETDEIASIASNGPVSSNLTHPLLSDEESSLLDEEPSDLESSEVLDSGEDAPEGDGADEDDIFQMPVSTIGGDMPPSNDDEDDDDDLLPKAPPLHRRYKIQEVIHKNQIILVQVAKEERGGKGAALTTFLSLAGRYCVLMPNSPRSGGISRKISTLSDRKRLREILDSFDIPSGMGLIVRTAGKDRTRIELRRDAQYLMRLWDGIRSLTLKSVAPALVNREDNIIKRAIRDLYTKEISDVIVEGENGYKIAKDFMKTLMPSHSKRVQRFKMENQPLFHHYGVESQIDDMHDAEVRLPSGGSIVIHPTEALVSIDINSGKATKERHIEKTATKTNLEAAAEIARQVKLRDLAGLIVIDFIDMDEPRHIASVEKKVRDAFRHDRARIQLGRIGPFGLLEMSRQRLAPSLLERSAHPCPHCQATGFIRSTESFALHVIRLLEEEGNKKNAQSLRVDAPAEVIFYLMNHKRKILADIEIRHDLKIVFEPLKSNVQSCTLVRLGSVNSTNTQLLDEDTPQDTSGQKKKGPNADSNKKAGHHQNRQKTSPQARKETSKPDSSSQINEEKSRVSPQDDQKNEGAEATFDPTATAAEKEEAPTRKRRPRRRSRRPRRPQADAAQEAVQSSSPNDAQEAPSKSDRSTKESETKRDDSQDRDDSQNMGTNPSSASPHHQKRAPIDKASVSDDGQKNSSEKEKSNWWRRLLD